MPMPRPTRRLQERDLPLAFHAAFNWADSGLSMTNRFIAVHALGFTWHNMLHLTNWIVNGMPERFPRLKTIWIESGLAWIPFLMQRLDNEYMMRTSDCALLKKKPSDYMRDMYFTSQPMEMVDNSEGAGAHLRDDQRGDAAALFLRLSALGHGPAEHDPRPAVPERAGPSATSSASNARRLFNLEPVLSEVKQRRLAARGVPPLPRSSQSTRSIVVPHALAQRRDVDLLHAAAAGEIERVRGGRPHGDAGAHDPHARERRAVAVDAAAGRHDVVGLGRDQAAERHVVQVVVGERLPDIALRAVVQLDRPGRARDGVGKLGAGAHVVDRELLAAA